jgi:4-amino-4-deoxy-L-arabinose transferase-like glycosyltransferase
VSTPLETRTRRLALLAILVLAFALRFHALDQNGWGADYYTAAVRSMATDAHLFWFAAFDPAGFLSVDKPPLALWIQALVVKTFGFRPYSVLMPQVVAGVLSVAVLYRMTRPRLGATCALLAALLFATTPVWVAVNRTNIMDTWLVLLLLIAGWALLCAVERGSRMLLMLCAAVTGLAFNVKMLAAFQALPAFWLVYVSMAPGPPRRRILDLAAATLVLAAICLPWPLLVEATNPSQRPYVGSTSGNSMLELITGHNAAGRLVARAPVIPERSAGSVTGPGIAPDGPSSGSSPGSAPGSSPGSSFSPGPSSPADPGPFRALNRLFVHTPAGPLRLTDGLLAAQASWWLPFAALSLLAALRGTRNRGDNLAQQKDARAHAPGRPALLMWIVWFATCALIYSAAGGILHLYYLSMLAPPLSVLAASVISGLSQRALHADDPAARHWLCAAMLATAAWQTHIQTSALGWTPAWSLQHMDDWRGWIQAASALGACAAGVAMLIRRPMATGMIAMGLSLLMVVPLAWTFSSVLAPAHGMVPSADLHRLDPDQSLIDLRIRAAFGRSPDHHRLIDFLQRQRGGERYLLSTTTTQLAAPLIIATGEPVMARGGYHGLDRAATRETIERAVAAGALRFAMIGDASQISRRLGADAAQRPIDDWIRTHGRRVDPALWRTPGSRTRGDLYDLRPDNGIASGAQGRGMTWMAGASVNAVRCRERHAANDPHCG